MGSVAASSLRIHEMGLESSAVQRLIAEMNRERRARMPEFTPSGGSTVEATDFVVSDGVFLVAAQDDDLLGCAGLRRLGPRVGEIKRLFVSPRFRRRGIARALMEALEERGRSLGYRTLRLDTDGGEPGPAALFRALGYHPIDDYNEKRSREVRRAVGTRTRGATPTRSCPAACW